jgi:hypothetical protein
MLASYQSSVLAIPLVSCSREAIHQSSDKS